MQNLLQYSPPIKLPERRQSKRRPVEGRQGNQLITLKQALHLVLSFGFERLRLPKDGTWLQFGTRCDDLNAPDLYMWRRLQCSFAVARGVLHLTRLLNREWLSTVAHRFMLMTL